MNNELIIPKHIGIIVDGNGRWATERGLPRSMGHKVGAENLKKVCLYLDELGVKYLSVYVFSTENFKRENKEVEFLMDLFVKMFKSEFNEIIKRGIKVVFSGRRDRLRKEVLEAMDYLEEATSKNHGSCLNICLNYGGQSEIVDMTKKRCQMYKEDKISLDDIDVELVRKNLYQDLPPVDFLIRTSGELRLSNFLLYQASYAELYFPKTYFPDFKESDVLKAIEEFNKRDRRFGGNK